uniref:Coiled-coil domain containing 125 n=1 Tax=Echeneis naucrates TaxID=173247 RepID=A0A665VUN2_ECHNA
SSISCTLYTFTEPESVSHPYFYLHLFYFSPLPGPGSVSPPCFHWCKSASSVTNQKVFLFFFTQAILDKATIHTKSLLQKCEEKAKALEKEVNSLQWELNFNQVQMKKSEQSWEQKHDRIANENKSLAESLQVRDSEIQQLRAENTALNRQCVELLSMLNVKEKRTYQETKPQYSQKGDASVLELAVLGACRCPGVVEVVEVCPCSRAAAASRRQLIELQQELDAQQSKREEAVMVADAFRIAFEQQLRRRSERLLLPAGANILKTNYNKAEGEFDVTCWASLPTLWEFPKLMHIPEASLLNDKEEALAHQRKVSIMLAHSAEELQRQLHLSSLYQPSERSEASIPSKLPQHQSQSENQPQEQKARLKWPRANSSKEREIVNRDLSIILSRLGGNASGREDGRHNLLLWCRKIWGAR